MPDPDAHFPGCHPEHARDEREPDGLPAPGETQDCWHCGTPTPQGCTCPDCLEGDDYVPADRIYHCPLCKRWWATMIPVITKITFGAEEAQRDEDEEFAAEAAEPDDLEPLRPVSETCKADGTREDQYGGEHYWNCAQPGEIDVDGTLMCLDHAGELGYGPRQEEYGFDPDDGLNPTPKEADQ